MELNTPPAAEELSTIADAARRARVSYSAMNYACLKLHLQPAKLVGTSRLFRESQIRQLLAAVAASARACKRQRRRRHSHHHGVIHGIQEDPLRIGGISHIQQFFGLWAALPEFVQGALQIAKTADLAAHVDRIRTAAADGESLFAVPASISNGIAIIDLSGALTKFPSSLEATPGTVAIRQAIRVAADDPQISGIMLRIDSPGGTFSGTADLASEVSRAASKKPTQAFIEDLCASGGLLDCQCLLPDHLQFHGGDREHRDLLRAVRH